MKSREIVAGLTLVGALSGCTAEVQTNGLENRALAVESPTTLDLGSISVESSLPLIKNTTTVPKSTLPEIAFTIDDEIAELRELAELRKTNPTTSVATQQSTVQQEVVSEPNDTLIPREALFDGNKLADITVTNPEGDVLVDLPLFVVTDLFNEDLVDSQLERGAMLLVNSPDVNPDKYGDEVGVPQMGLPGEIGPITNVFAHNLSFINPDFDGDISNGNEGVEQRAFHRLSNIQDGAILTVDYSESTGLEPQVYTMIGTRIVKDVQPGGEGTGMSFLKAQELYRGNFGGSNRAIQLIKCEPRNGNPVLDRFIAVFEPAE